MSAITAGTLRAAALRAHAAMAASEQQLNEADGRLGDGDTGSMLARLTEAVANADASGIEDIGVLLSLYARTAAGATGSSLGTLVATALLAVSRATRGKGEIRWGEVSPLIEVALGAMMHRGGAAPGDKTVLDSVSAIAEGTRGKDDAAAVGAAVFEATRAALVEFRDKPNRIGRARMFAERSVGLDDPGMLACQLLVSSLAAGVR